MAGVFEHSTLTLLHRELDRPGPRVHGGVDHRSAIGNGVRTRACEAFGDTQVFIAHAVILNTKAALVARAKVGGVNHQRFPFPVAYRITLPLPHVLWQRRPGCCSVGQRNHARLVPHF